MKNTEIKEIKEYCWGSVVTIIEDNDTKTVITAKSSYLGAAFIAANLCMFLVGYLLARL